MINTVRRVVLMGKKVSEIVYLLRDEFLTNEGAPLASPRTCEPGPGTITVVDTAGNDISIVGSRLTFAGLQNWNNSYVYGNAITRLCGVSVLFQLTINNNQTSAIGWARAGAFSIPDAAALILSPGLIRQYYLGSASGSIGIHTVGVSYRYLIVLRNTGSLLFVIGGIYANWTLLWVNNLGAHSPIYPAIGNDSCIESSDYIRAMWLSSPWNIDYGFTTDRLAGARAPGDLFIHNANCLIEFIQTTVPAALQTELRFRVQDANNYWQVTIDNAGNLDLDEVVAGVPVQRGTSAAVIANGDRIVIVADGITIRIYEQNNLRITYAAAVNFQLETDGELETEGTAGSVSDIISWPRVLSSYALAELNKYV